ncbi:MAG: hypothetical protein A4E19_05920 [Nitrospira sp. SG-bin1]|nr:MAG: hypothetical protein A4E19_05920 [Nitrospira sp. SG-bin1]
MNRIALELVADNNPLLKALKVADDAIKSFMGSTESASRHFDEAQSGLRNMGMGFLKVGGQITATAAALGALGLAAAKELGSFAENIEILSQQTGISQETIQKWDFALSRVNLSVNDLIPGFKKLSTLTADAFASEKGALDNLDKIGLSVDALRDKNPEQVFLTLAGAIAKIQDPLLRNAALVDTFGRDGLSLVPILGEVADGFQKSGQQAEALGLVLASGALASAQQLDDSFGDLGRTMAGFSRTIASTFAGPLREVIDVLTQTLGAFNRWWQGLDAGTQQAITIFAVAFAASGPIIATIGAFMVAVSAGLGPLMVGGAIVTGIVGAVGAIAANFTRLKQSVIETVTGMVEAIKMWLSDKLMAIVAPVQKAADAVLNIFKRLRHEVVGGSEVPDMVEEIGDHMRMLDKRMTAPARVAAQGTWEVFRELATNMDSTSRQVANTVMSVWTSASSTMSNALAAQIIKGNDWKATMESIATTALSAFIQLGIGLATQSALQLAINTTKNGAIVAGDAAAAGATVSIWGAAAGAITGIFGTVSGAIMGFFTETLIPFFVAIGKALMAFLSSIAGAASSTIFGIPYAVAILAGVALIGAAIGTLMAFAFADGGITTGPTLAMIGEGQTKKEAVIPLNKRGAAFMRDAMGGGGGRGGPVTINVELDGRTIAKTVFDNMQSVMHIRGVRA